MSNNVLQLLLLSEDTAVERNVAIEDMAVNEVTKLARAGQKTCGRALVDVVILSSLPNRLDLMRQIIKLSRSNCLKSTKSGSSHVYMLA